MLFDSVYKTVQQSSEYLFKDKGSKFYALVAEVQSEEAFKAFLKSVRNRFPDATHHCYALVLNPDQSFQKSSDDGEPANTAGKPILRAILSAGLTNTAVIVVRYFGGTLLGVPGLINAYHNAAAASLKLAGVKEYEITNHFRVSGNIEDEKDAHRLIKIIDAKIHKTAYEDGFNWDISITRSKVERFKTLAKDFYHLTLKEIP